MSFAIAHNKSNLFENHFTDVLTSYISWIHSHSHSHSDSNSGQNLENYKASQFGQKNDFKGNQESHCDPITHKCNASCFSYTEDSIYICKKTGNFHICGVGECDSIMSRNDVNMCAITCQIMPLEVKIPSSSSSTSDQDSRGNRWTHPNTLTLGSEPLHFHSPLTILKSLDKPEMINALQQILLQQWHTGLHPISPARGFPPLTVPYHKGLHTGLHPVGPATAYTTRVVPVEKKPISDEHKTITTPTYSAPPWSLTMVVNKPSSVKKPTSKVVKAVKSKSSSKLDRDKKRKSQKSPNGHSKKKQKKG